ncbi:MAG: hypothetical protein HYX37_19740 [Rhizobiales bacterium]|nr:hypothetical protein [Hyphomicrobiales bacterium]
MKMMHGATAVVASVLAMMLLAPSDVAQARASGARGLHFPAHHHSARHLARHRFPHYGGYVILPPYDPYVTYALPQPIGFVSESRSCRYDRQVVTVASEQGGTRQITITRC